MEPKKGNTVHILEDRFCKDCGWPVIDACCNDEFRNFKDAGEWDWWLYCSNKGCKNHDGEGIFQSTPKWVLKEPEDNSPTQEIVREELDYLEKSIEEETLKKSFEDIVRENILKFKKELEKIGIDKNKLDLIVSFWESFWFWFISIEKVAKRGEIEV